MWGLGPHARAHARTRARAHASEEYPVPFVCTWVLTWGASSPSDLAGKMTMTTSRERGVLDSFPFSCSSLTPGPTFLCSFIFHFSPSLPLFRVSRRSGWKKRRISFLRGSRPPDLTSRSESVTPRVTDGPGWLLWQATTLAPAATTTTRCEGGLRQASQGAAAALRQLAQ